VAINRHNNPTLQRIVQAVLKRLKDQEAATSRLELKLNRIKRSKEEPLSINNPAPYTSATDPKLNYPS
jgi:hypothetical protein